MSDIFHTGKRSWTVYVCECHSGNYFKTAQKLIYKDATIVDMTRNIHIRVFRIQRTIVQCIRPRLGRVS